MMRSAALTASSTVSGIEAVLNGELAVGTVLAIGDDDFDAAVAQVQTVGVSLRAEAKNGDGFATEGIERSVIFIDHFKWLGHCSNLP